MENNEDFLLKWIKGDEKLLITLNEIENTDVSIEEQAELVFCRVADLYNLPKMPSDIIDEEEDKNEEMFDDDYDPRSVFMELGLLKILHPEEDKRTLVLIALYLVKNKINADADEAFEIMGYSEKGDNKGIGFKGVNNEVQTLVIGKNDKSWFELGCVAYIKNA